MKYIVKMYGLKETSIGNKKLPGYTFERDFDSKEDLNEFIDDCKKNLKVLKHAHSDEEMPEFTSLLIDSGDFYTSIIIETESFLKKHKSKTET